MTELQLYKYITENNIEWHRYENNGEDDVLIFPYFYQIEDFRKIISGCVFDEEGIEMIHNLHS